MKKRIIKIFSAVSVLLVLSAGCKKFLDVAPDNIGTIANVAGSLSNQASINKMKTHTTPRTIGSPRFSYFDGSNSIINRNNRAYRESLLNAERSGLATSGTISALNTGRMNINADISNTEASRKQQAIEGYLGRSLQVDQANSGILSQNDFLNTQRYNEKQGLTQANMNNAIQGVIGNQATKDMRTLEQDKAKITATMQGGRGITKRDLENNPELRASYIRLFGQEYVDNLLAK